MIARAGASLPTWARLPAVLLILLVLNVALALAAYELLSHGLPATAGATESVTVVLRDDERLAPARRARRLGTAVTVLAVAAGAAGWGVRHGQDEVVVDLMERLDEAAMESPRGLHGAFEVLDVAINGQLIPAVFAHAPSKITWRIDVPACASLRADLGIVPGVWEQPGDGVSFRVGVAEGGAYHELHTRHVNPMGALEDRVWIPIDVALAPYAGRPVELILETLAGPADNPWYDWALWGAPRVVCAR
jgi:hypothetical protein